MTVSESYPLFRERHSTGGNKIHLLFSETLHGRILKAWISTRERWFFFKFFHFEAKKGKRVGSFVSRKPAKGSRFALFRVEDKKI
jgi:hypothetical protein